MNVFIPADKSYTNELKYIWRIFANNKQIPFEFINNKEKADFIIDNSPETDLYFNPEFYEKIINGIFSTDKIFDKDCMILTSEVKKDYLSSAFYMINCLQEYGSKDQDIIGRYKFNNSYQYKYGNIEVNLVQYYFDQLQIENPKLSNIPSIEKKTKFFLTHDIDSINGALFQDSLAVLKRGNPLPVFKLLFNAVLNRPDWFNMDRIMKMESEFDYKSTFYWLVNKGRINKRIVNSDYNINDKKIRRMLGNIEQNGFENGLHKSITSDSFEKEFNKLQFKPIGNRFHYLKIILPDSYELIEKSGLKLDASLGFAEAFGFRNNYGLPFYPYNLTERRSYNFIEVPLHIMDGTFMSYMNIPMEQTADTMISFIEKNKTNCVLSVLWHNTSFGEYKYKGYGEQYKKLLSYLYENKFECITQSEIIKEYSWY